MLPGPMVNSRQCRHTQTNATCTNAAIYVSFIVCAGAGNPDMRMSEITPGHAILAGRGLGVHSDTSNQILSRLASDFSEGCPEYILATGTFPGSNWN